MALCAAPRVFHAECLGAVMTGAAVRARLQVFHGKRISALFHLEQAALMAISAFVAGLAMSIAVEFHGLAGANCKDGSRHNKRYHYYEGCYDELLHLVFTSLLFMRCEPVYIQRIPTWHGRRSYAFKRTGLFTEETMRHVAIVPFSCIVRHRCSAKV